MTCLYIIQKVHVACDLNFTDKSEGLLKVIGSHVQCKNGNVLETVLGDCVITIGHQQEVIYGIKENLYNMY